MMVQEYVRRPLVANEKEIDENRYILTQRIDAWRAHQQTFMPTVSPHVLALPPCTAEEDSLLLPSDFTAPQREELALCEIAKDEVDFREGQACETILQLRSAVKHLSSLQALKAKNASGQAENTRAFAKIDRAQFTCEYILEIYKQARGALESLGRLDDARNSQRFPVLTRESLQRKPTTVKKALGDTYAVDGGLWTSGGTFDFPASRNIQSTSTASDTIVSSEGAVHSLSSFSTLPDRYSSGFEDQGTQMRRRQSNKRALVGSNSEYHSLTFSIQLRASQMLIPLRHSYVQNMIRS
jgi:hypothetical protein